MFGKVFKQIYASSIARDYKVRHIFMDFIVLADSDGVVDMTHEAISATTGVPIETLRTAIAILEKPDTQSRSKEENGARLIPLDPDRNWGWQIVNYVKYRLIASESDRREKTRDRVRKHRQKKELELVTQCNACNARERERDKKKDKKKEKNKESLYHKDSKTALHCLNQLTGKSFRETDSNLAFISARLEEPGVTIDGVQMMIARQVKRWMGTDQAEYLRPETLFNKTKFDGYYASREQPINENNTATNRKGFDRNKGTFNEGTAHLYKAKPIQPPPAQTKLPDVL